MIIKKEYESKFDDCKKIDIEGLEMKRNENLNDFHIHYLIRQILLLVLMLNFDAIRLYPSAMWDENSNYLQIETGYAYRKYMKGELVEKKLAILINGVLHSK